MARHSFIQISKLSDVKGRISYISDPKRQEYLFLALAIALMNCAGVVEMG